MYPRPFYKPDTKVRKPFKPLDPADTNRVINALSVSDLTEILQRGHDKCTPERAKRVLEALLEGNNFTRAAKKAGINPNTLFYWRSQDETFNALCLKCKEQGEYNKGEQLENELDNRVMQGDDCPVIHEGEITTTYKKKSEKLLLAYLAATNPKKYGRQQNITVDIHAGLGDRLAERIRRAEGEVIDAEVTEPESVGAPSEPAAQDATPPAEVE